MPLGKLAHERESREPDHEPVRGRPGAESENGCQCDALRLWKSFDLVHHGEADLVESAVRELQLGLDADGARDTPAAVEAVCEVGEQGALANACLAAKDQDLAPAVEDVRQGALEGLSLRVTSEQPWSPSPTVEPDAHRQTRIRPSASCTS
jgi:hypothetical protein